MRPDRDVRVRRIRVPTEHGGMPALVLSPPAAPKDAAGVPAQLDVYHCDMHAFDMMRPDDVLSIQAAEAFNTRFADAQARFFAPQHEIQEERHDS